MDPMLGIRSRIAELAENRGPSRRAFARGAGLGENTLSSIINGDVETVTVETLQKIADFAKVPLEYLIVGVMPKTPEIARDVDRHPNPAFHAGARAFLEIEAYSEEAVATVRRFLVARFRPAHAWTPREWFALLSDDHGRRSRALEFPTEAAGFRA